MPTRSADDFDAIRKRLEELRKEEPSKSTINEVVKEDKEPTPMADEYYGCGYNQMQYYKQHNVTVKD